MGIVAAAQIAPVFYDARESAQRVAESIGEAARTGGGVAGRLHGIVHSGLPRLGMACLASFIQSQRGAVRHL